MSKSVAVQNSNWSKHSLRTLRAIRMLLKSPRDQTEENYLVVTVQQKGNPVLAGLREAYWRHWEGHHIPEFRVTIREMKEKPHPPPPKRP